MLVYAASGLGSTHIRPNQSADVHAVPLLPTLLLLRLAEDVDEKSLHPNQPGVLHVLVAPAVDVDDAELTVEEGIALDDVAIVDVGLDESVVNVGAGAGDGLVMVVVCVVVLSSLQPNQPGVMQVVVVIVLVMVAVEMVVLSSKQPHQPGVLHVSTLVRVEDVDVGSAEVVVSVPLDS